MKKNHLITLVLISFCLIFSACGDSGDKPAKTEKKSPKISIKKDGVDKGVVVARAILATFDQAVNETVELTKAKTAAAEVKPKLRALIQKYTEKMQELNKKYLALKTEDIALFGSANGYLGENRGKHVYGMDQKLYTMRNHYQQQTDKEMDALLHQELINLLETAVKR